MAKDFVEREAAIMTAMNYDGNGTAQDASQDIAASLVCIPAADVRPVVRGRWIRRNDGFIYCRECDVMAEIGDCGDFLCTKFCPNCGADMREAQDDN